MIAFLLGCQGPDSPSTEESGSESEPTADTSEHKTGDTAEPVLPGTDVPAPEDQLAGYAWIRWNNREHLSPGASFLELDAGFWEEVHFGDIIDVLRPGEGLDTCEAYFLGSDGSASSIPARAGELAVTLDDKIWFQGPPNSFGSTGNGDVAEYAAERPEPAFGSAVGISATGEGVIPAFDFPLVGWMAPADVGAFSPGRDDVVELDDLSFTWENTVGGTIQLLVSLGYVNFDCELVDDGAWDFPAEYLPLLTDMYIPVGAATLYRESQRWLPLGDEQYLWLILRTQTSWGFGVAPVTP